MGSKGEALTWLCLLVFSESIFLMLPERFQKAVAASLSIISGGGFLYFSGLVIPHAPVVTLRFWEAGPFLTVVFVSSGLYQIFQERRLATELIDLADATDEFEAEVRTRHLVPMGHEWQAVRREYVRQYGKKAAALMRGTPYNSALEYALKPQQLRDFRVVQVMLRAYAGSLGQDRLKRWIIKSLPSPLYGFVVFMLAWLLLAVRSGKL